MMVMIIPGEVTAVVAAFVFYLIVTVGWFAAYSVEARAALRRAEDLVPRARRPLIDDARAKARSARLAPIWPVLVVASIVRAARSATTNTRAIADGTTSVQRETREQLRQQEIDRLERENARLRDEQEGDR